MGDVTPLLDSTGTTRQVSVDRISTRDGSAAATNEEVQLVKVGWGAEDDLQSASSTRPVPVREPVLSAPIAHGGVTATGSSQALRTADANRKYIEVANDHATDGVWVRFGAAAAVTGQGGYVPPKSAQIWTWDGEVRVIGTSGTAIGFVAW